MHPHPRLDNPQQERGIASNASARNGVNCKNGSEDLGFFFSKQRKKKK